MPLSASAPSARFAQHALHQAGIVGHCVEEARAAEQAILADARRQVAQLLQRVEQMVALAGQGVVQTQQTAEYLGPGKPPR